jgi:hypothetical protein
MKYIETPFSKELSDLLLKHKKTLTSDKGGIYAVDTTHAIKILLSEAEVASEDTRPQMLFLIN